VNANLPTLGLLDGVGRRSPDDLAQEQRGPALQLYGGGYRAALFHLGALTRLNELGLLANLDTVGAVAGGSILAALLAARVPWPLHGAFRDWPEAVVEPMREIASRNARARALLRRAISSGPAGAALEERYARELVESLGGEPAAQPRFVFGAAGLALGEIAPVEGGLTWRIEAAASPPGYDPALVREAIVAMRDDLDAFGDAEQAVLENHGYLLADAAVRAHGREMAGAIEPLAPEPPHPQWMDEGKVREALATSSRRTRLGRIRPRRAGRGERSPESASSQLTAQLERLRPFVQYDSLESYRADSVATIANLAAGKRCNTLHRADGRLIAAAAPRGEEAQLDLDFLGGQAYANGEQVLRGDFLDESGASYAADARMMRAREGCADVVYGHARHDGSGRLWLQYWFFFYYNDKGFLDIGLHEGDWEMVQLRLGEDGRPDAVTYGQHAGGERAEWTEVERQQTDAGAAPVVYCARGSHAARFRPGTYEAPIVPDHNDGLGPRVRPRLVAIGDDGPGWVLWPGRWGSTRRREAFEADSPRGPREHAGWWDPAGFHEEARPVREVPHWEMAPASTPPPPAPSLTARRDGVRVVVEYRFPEPAAGGATPARIVAAPYGGKGSGVPRTRSVTVKGREGSFVLQPAAGERPEGVRASAASERGVPGATVAVPVEDGERAG
jgi:Vacuolar protein sorting-associated protein 62